MCRHNGLVFGLAITFSSGALAAPDGWLDPTFGVNGLQTAGFDLDDVLNWDYGKAAAVLPDGRLLIAASAMTDDENNVIGLVRLSADGQFDDGFGKPWYRPTGVAGAVASDMAVQTDGRIVVAGYASIGGNDRALVCRFLPDGSPDTGFAPALHPLAGTGCRLVQPENVGSFSAIVVQRDGRIALAGSLQTNVMHGLVARLDVQGNLDGDFDNDGVHVLLPASTNNTYLADLAETPEGDLVAAGHADINGDNENWQVFRLRGEDGGLDTDFDGDGLKPIAIDSVPNGSDRARAVSVLPDSRIVVGGSARGNGDCPALARLHPNGAYDLSLDGDVDGRFIATDLCDPNLSIRDMVVQSDGRVILAGILNNDFYATRILPEGGLDPAFGLLNVSRPDFSAHFGGAYSTDGVTAAVSQGGRTILIGYADPEDGPGGSDIAIARLDNDLIYADDLE